MEQIIFKKNTLLQIRYQVGLLMLRALAQRQCFGDSNSETERSMQEKTGLSTEVLAKTIRCLVAQKLLEYDGKRYQLPIYPSFVIQDEFRLRHKEHFSEAILHWFSTGDFQELAKQVHSEVALHDESPVLLNNHYKIFASFISEASLSAQVRILDISDRGCKLAMDIDARGHSIDYYVPVKRYQELTSLNLKNIRIHQLRQLPAEQDRFDIVFADNLLEKFADSQSKVHGFLEKVLQNEGILVCGVSKWHWSTDDLLNPEPFAKTDLFLSERQGWSVKSIDTPFYREINYAFYLAKRTVVHHFEQQTVVAAQQENIPTDLKTIFVQELADLLETPIQEVDLSLDLEEMGLDSMLSIELATNLSRKMGIKINPAMFMAVQTGDGLITSLIDFANESSTKVSKNTLTTDNATKHGAEPIGKKKVSNYEQAEEMIKAEIAKVLETDIADISMDTELQELGLESMLIKELCDNLGRSLGEKINPALLMGVANGNELVHELASAGYLEKVWEDNPNQGIAPKEPKSTTETDIPSLSGQSNGAITSAKEELYHLVKLELATVLETSVSTLDLSVDLEEMGLDSMLSMELAAGLSRKLNQKINPTLLVGISTGHDLVRELEQKRLQGRTTDTMEEQLTHHLPESTKPSIENPTARRGAAFDETGEMKETLRSELADLLEVAPNDVDLSVDMEELGVDSMMGIELAAKLSRRLSVKINPSLLMELSTGMDLAMYLQKLSAAEASAASQNNVGEEKEQDIPPVAMANSDSITNDPSQAIRDEDIAIIGVSFDFPNAHHFDEYWSILTAPGNQFSSLKKHRSVTKSEAFDLKAGLLDKGVFAFEEDFFGMSKEEAQAMDPKQKILLKSAYHVFEEAGYAPEDWRGSDTGVFIGVENNEYALTDKNTKRVFSHHNATCMAANRISMMMDLHGPSETTDTACTSALSAIRNACLTLQHDEAAMAIAGGISIIYREDSILEGLEAGAISKSGCCRSFDGQGDGWVMGEGVGLVLLKKAKQALEDRDHIHGLIKGIGYTSSGKTKIPGVPNPEYLSKAARSALSKAALEPSALQYIDLHGLGLPLLDAVEIEGIQNVFGKEKNIRIGSATANLGNLEPACAMAGLMKTLACFQKEMYPPQLHFDRLAEFIDPGTLEINNETLPWKEKQKNAGVSVYGYSGVNAFMVLSSFDKTSLSPSDDKGKGPFYLKISARTVPQLRVLAKTYREYVEHTPISLYDFTATANRGREDFEQRLLLCFSDQRELMTLLEQVMAFPERSVNTGPIGPAVLKDGLPTSIGSWPNGADVDWECLYPKGTWDKLSLPLYPFLKQPIETEKSALLELVYN